MLPGYTDEALALRLAMTVNDKSDVELEELARANPHLHQEWLEELGATRQCARAQAELCETALTRLRAARRATIANVA